MIEKRTISYDEDDIPEFIHGTQMYEYAKIEVEYKKSIIQDFNEITKNLTLMTESRYFLDLFLMWFRLPTQSGKSFEVLRDQLNTVAYCYQNIGTHDSFVYLFDIFLGVKIKINIIEEPGLIRIHMLNAPVYSDFAVLTGSDNVGMIVNESTTKQSILSEGEANSPFINSFYLYVKSLILEGIVLEIVPPVENPTLWDGTYLWDGSINWDGSENIGEGNLTAQENKKQGVKK